MLCHLLNDDVPNVILRLSTDESLCAEASTQEIDTSESLRPLSAISANTVFERPGYFRLPGLAHGIILVSLDRRAEVEVYGEQDIPDGDKAVPRGDSDVGRNRE